MRSLFDNLLLFIVVLDVCGIVWVQCRLVRIRTVNELTLDLIQEYSGLSTMSIPCGIKIFRVLSLLVWRIVTSVILHLWVLHSLAHFMNSLFLFLLWPVCQLVYRDLSLYRRLTALSVLHEVRRAWVASTGVRPEPRRGKAWLDWFFWLFELTKTSSWRNLSVWSSICYTTSATWLQVATNWRIVTSSFSRWLP